MSEAPAFWQDLARAFGDWLATPPALTPRGLAPPRPPARLAQDLRARGASAISRLALYHAQGWDRLCGAIQDAFPRVSCVLGDVTFRARVRDHLVARPPAGHDLAAAADGFAAGLRGTPPAEVAPDLLLSALALDEAEQGALLAPPPSSPSFAPLKPRLGPGVSLVAVAFSGLVTPGAEPIAPLARPLHVVVAPGERGVTLTELTVIAARFLHRATLVGPAAAHAELLAACPERLRGQVGPGLDAVARQALAAGWWVEARD